MADRNMRNKRFRMRMKGKLRKWSEATVNTGPSASDRNIQKFEAIHAVADAVLEFIPNDPTQVIKYRRRAKSLTRTHKGPVPFNDPRMNALHKRRELITNDIQPFLSIVVRNEKFQKLELCFNIQKTVWVIYKEDYIFHKAVMSVQYNSKELALAVIRNNSFKVQEEVSLLE